MKSNMKRRNQGKRAKFHPTLVGDGLVKALELRKLYDIRPVSSYKSFKFRRAIDYKNSIIGLIYNGIARIKSKMRETDVGEITMRREYLPEIFDEAIIIISSTDGFPKLTSFATKYFQERGLKIKYSPSTVTFKKNYKGK